MSALPHSAFLSAVEAIEALAEAYPDDFPRAHSAMDREDGFFALPNRPDQLTTLHGDEYDLHA